MGEYMVAMVDNGLAKQPQNPMEQMMYDTAKEITQENKAKSKSK